MNPLYFSKEKLRNNIVIYPQPCDESAPLDPSYLTAEGNEAKAIIDYEISLGNLEKAKGTILDTYDIKLEEEETKT